MKKNNLLLAALLVTELVLLVLIALWLTQTIYTISMGYWTFFTMVLLALIASAVAFDRTSKPLAVLYAILTVFAFGTFVACCSILTVPNTRGLGFEVKLFFSFVVTIQCGVFAYVLKQDKADEETKALLPEKGGEESGEEEGACMRVLRGCNIWFTFCSVFLFVMVVAAACHTMLHASEINQFFPGEEALTEINGHKIFARCSGTGSPPVVFFHGLNGNSLDFIWVQREISKVTKTCSFDRPGYGQSREFGTGDRTSAQHAIEAEAMLQDNGITGDFIAVGHSYAGFNMRTYNRDYPGRMQGMVLVDTVNPNPNFTSSCDPDEEYSYGLLFNLGVFIADAGILRVINAFGLIDLLGYDLSDLPADTQTEYFANIQSYFAKTALDEFRVWGKSCSGLRSLPEENKTLPFPIAVIAAENGIFEENLIGAEEQAELSENSTYILVPESTHSGVIFREELANITTQEVLKLIDFYNSP